MTRPIRMISVPRALSTFRITIFEINGRMHMTHVVIFQSKLNKIRSLGITQIKTNQKLLAEYRMMYNILATN